MKILFINNFFGNFGGTENSIFSTSKILEQNGHEVFFFATDKKPYFIPDYEYSGFFPEYKKYYDMNAFQRARQAFKYLYNFDAKKKLDEYLKLIQPDIVEINNISFYLTVSVIDACKENNIPVVMVLRDPSFACPGSTLMIGDEKYCQEKYCIKHNNPIYCVKHKCYNKSLLKSINACLTALFLKAQNISTKVDKFVCASNAMRELAIESGISSDKVTVVNNFISDFYFEHKPNYKNKGYFLYVGRISKEKGINYLIDAFAKLPKEIELHIVGEGREKENLMRQAEKLNLTNVSFIEPKYGEDLIDEYQNCIASIIPSIWLEAFGLTIVESFSQGKPVIASNIGGMPEIIDKNTGIIVEPGNVDEIAQAVLKLYSNPDLVIKMGEKARKKAESKYSSQVKYENLVKVFHEFVDNNLSESCFVSASS